MPLTKFATKDEIPADKADKAIAFADGSFGIFEDVDITPLQTRAVEAERKLEAATSTNNRLSGELQTLKNNKSAEDAGIPAEKLAQIRADVRAEVMTELQPQIDQGKSAITKNRELQCDSKVKALAIENGVRPELINQWWKMYGDQFDLTADGTEPVVKGKEGVSVKAHIGALKPGFPDLYVGTKAAGAGTAGDKTGTAPTTDGKADPLVNPSQALREARAAGATE